MFILMSLMLIPTSNKSFIFSALQFSKVGISDHFKNSLACIFIKMVQVRIDVINCFRRHQC